MKRYLTQGLRRAGLLPAVALVLVAGVLVLDLVAFWGWGLRPVASVDGVEIAVWSILAGTAVFAGIRWGLLGNPQMRFHAAASIALMVAFSVLHPWQSGYAVDAEMPVPSRQVPEHAVVKFDDGPLTEAESSRW